MRPWVVLIGVILLFSALKASAPVTMPLAFALLLVALFWPLQRRLVPHVGKGLALLANLLLLLGFVGLLAYGLWYSAELVASADRTATYVDDFQQRYTALREWARSYGVSLPTIVQGSGTSGESGNLNQHLVDVGRRFLSSTGMFILIVSFFVLALLEVPDFRRKLADISPRHEVWQRAGHEVAHGVLRVMVIRTGVSLLTGLLIGGFSWAIGLDFAFIWGLANFLLNYIPTLGSIVGVLPPSLFAFVQFGGWAALGAAAGIAAIQLIIGNYVDPRIQGKYLELSPVVVLLSVVLWGWVWGIAGAIIGVPITLSVVIVCDHFDRTRWLATLLAEAPGEDEDDAP